MKGKMKKLFALALAAIMVLAMGITASATGEEPITPQGGKIIIENPILQPPAQEGAEQQLYPYVAYKIFSVTTSEAADGKTNYGYKLDNTSAVYSLLAQMDQPVQQANGVEITPTTVEGVYNVNVTDAPAFAQYLNTQKAKLTGGINGILNSETGKVEITIPADKMGYYFVSTGSGALANLTTASSSTPVTIYDKNETPKIEKTTTLTGDVSIGQNVPYTITGKVPSTVGYDQYTYIVTDKLGTGLTFNNDLTVKVGTATIYANNTVAPSVDGIEVDKNSTDYDFKLIFDMTKFNVGDTVEITYSATVNENAIEVTTGTADPLKNEAKLEYSKDLNNTTTDKTPGSDVTLYTANIKINKVVAGSQDPLRGAKFVLVDKVTKDDAGNITGVAPDAQYYQYIEAKEAEGQNPAVKAEVRWGTKADATEVVTDAQGKASFIGLADGTYYLVETEAPAGYNLMTKPQEVEVTHDTNEDNVIDDDEKVLLTVEPTVENSTGATLPSTGGIGTTIFYVVGGILVVVAGVLLITKKRMSGRD